MKEATFEWVYNQKRATCGGYGMHSKTDHEARAYITENTNMTTSESEVTIISFTRDDEGVLFLPIEIVWLWDWSWMFQKPYRKGMILAILASRIMRHVSGYGRSLVDIFPPKYNALPEELIADICAHVCDVCDLWLDTHSFHDRSSHCSGISFLAATETTIHGLDGTWCRENNGINWIS